METNFDNNDGNIAESRYADEEQTPNDANPMFSAMDAGIDEGGLRSKSDIAIIVCYLLANSDLPLTDDVIIETMAGGRMANYFEICDAISRQLKKGNIKRNDDGTLSLGSNREAAIKTLEDDLPLSIREKSIELCRRIAANEIIRKENKVEIKECDNKFSVTMHVADKESDFMTLTLNVPTFVQAQTIKEKFQKYPLDIYEKLMDSIFEQ